MAINSESNFDRNEQSHFDDLAATWWDTEGESRPLHELNPARVGFITECEDLGGKTVLDVGCGGGILSEAMARAGAQVTGIDIAERALAVAKLHAVESGLEIDYVASTAESFAEQKPPTFDVVTCLEMLEHVPDPGSVIEACAGMLKPGGHMFLSTLNRTPAAFAMAIVGAEHIARIIPKGTHRYDRFIKPSELCAALRTAGMEVRVIKGIHYNPLTRSAMIGGHVAVNYILWAQKTRASN